VISEKTERLEFDRVGDDRIGDDRVGDTSIRVNKFVSLASAILFASWRRLACSGCESQSAAS